VAGISRCTKIVYEEDQPHVDAVNFLVAEIYETE
jgi:hypothetical protein